jgi:iron complex outermembrane receptor protein
MKLGGGVAALIACILVVPRAASSAEFPESPDQPSAFVTIYDAAEYDDRFETVEDLLRRTPGVRVRRFGGLGTFSTASVRGSKPEQVLVLLDGVRLNSNRTGTVDLSAIPLREIDRIEIVRGGGSARHGSQAVGGVIAMTTRSAVEPGTQADAALSYGRYETLGLDAGISHAGQQTRFAGSYSRLQSDNDFLFERVEFREVEATELPCENSRICSIEPELAPHLVEYTRKNADFGQDTGALSIDRDIGRRTRVFGSLNLHQKRNGQPGSLQGKEVVDISSDELSCLDARESLWRSVGRLGFSRRLAGDSLLDLTLFYRSESSELEDPGGKCGFVNPDLLGGIDEVDWDESTTGATLRFAGSRWRWGPLSTDSRASTELRLEQVNGDLTERRDRLVTSLSYQQELSLFEGALRVFPAIGLETASSSDGEARSRQFLGVEEVETNDDAEWLPGVGAILRLGSAVRLKANWLRVYRRPTFEELFYPDLGFVRGNPRLEPEEGVNRDVGIELALDAWGPLDMLRGEVVAFDRDLDEGIEWMLSGSNAYEPINTGSANLRGWEMSLELSLLQRLGLAVSYTKTRSEIEHNGAPLPNRPDYRLNLHADYDFGAGMIWAELEREDEFTLTATGATKAPATTQIDAGVVLRLRELPGLGRAPDGLTLSFEVVNATEEQRIDARGLPLPAERIGIVKLRAELP